MNAERRAARGTEKVEKASALPPTLSNGKSKYGGGSQPKIMDEFGENLGKSKWGGSPSPRKKMG